MLVSLGPKPVDLVMKFGGTSVDGPVKMQRMVRSVLDKVNEGYAPVVVVSAMGDTTDRLVEMLAKISRGDKPGFYALADSLISFHEECLRHILARESDGVIMSRISHFHFLAGPLFMRAEYLFGMNPTEGDLSNRFYAERSGIIGMGEILSAFIAVSAFESANVFVRHVDAREIFVMSRAPSGVSLDEAETASRIKEKLGGERTEITVVPGFIASTPDGNPALMERGGSNLTASVIGATLGVKMIMMCSDVPGILTADPRIVSEAMTIPELTYSELLMMSLAGANVMYPGAVSPAEKKRIPIVFCNSQDILGDKSVVDESGSLNDSSAYWPYNIKSVNSIGGLVSVTIGGTYIMGRSGSAERVTAALYRCGINLDMIIQPKTERSITVTISEKDLRVAKYALENEFEKEVTTGLIDNIQVDEDIAVVTVVGNQMRDKIGVLADAARVLADAGVSVKQIAQDSRQEAISFAICGREEHRIARALHRFFFG